MGRRNELRRNTKRLNICDFCNGIITYFTIKGINLKVNLYFSKKKKRVSFPQLFYSVYR